MCVRAGSVTHPRNHAHSSAFKSLAPWPRDSIPPQAPSAWGHGSHQFLNRTMTMKAERFAGNQEAREALVLAVAGVTAIMLIANLILLILY